MWSYMVCWHISGSVDINKTSCFFKSTGFFLIRNRWKCRKFVKVIIWWICKATLSMFQDLVSEPAVHASMRCCSLKTFLDYGFNVGDASEKSWKSKNLLSWQFSCLFLCPSWPYLQYLVMDLFLVSLPLGLRIFAPFQTFWLLIWRWLIFSTRSSTYPCTCFMQSWT